MRISDITEGYSALAKKEDMLDMYDYILNYYNIDSDTIGIEDFMFRTTSMPIQQVPEVFDLMRKYKNLPEDLARVKAISNNLDYAYPIYIHRGHIIAGTHRAVAYLINDKTAIVSVILVSVAE